MKKKLFNRQRSLLKRFKTYAEADEARAQRAEVYPSVKNVPIIDRETGNELQVRRMHDHYALMERRIVEKVN